MLGCLQPSHSIAFTPRFSITKYPQALAQVERQSSRRALHKAIAILACCGSSPRQVLKPVLKHFSVQTQLETCLETSQSQERCNPYGTGEIESIDHAGSVELGYGRADYVSPTALTAPIANGTCETKCRLDFLLHHAVARSDFALPHLQQHGSHSSPQEPHRNFLTPRTHQSKTKKSRLNIYDAGLEVCHQGEDPAALVKIPRTRKIYACPAANCGKILCRKSYVIEHMRLHTGTRPFVCDVEGCGVAFRWRTNLARHVKTLHP
jgi:hypothetical protein